MLYNIVLVFVMHQHESPTVCTCPLLLEPPSHLPPHPIPLSCQSTQLSSLCQKQTPTGCVIRYNVSFHAALPVGLLPSLCAQVCSLCLCLRRCPANTFISTVYLEHICCSLAESCLALCYPMDCSMPSSPVLHYFLECSNSMSIKSVMLSNHLILCCPFLLLPLMVSSISIFSNESALHIRWPKYWSFSFSMSSSNKYFKYLYIFN